MDPHAGDIAFPAAALRRSLNDLIEAVSVAEGTEPKRGRQLCSYLRAALGAISDRIDSLEQQFAAAASDAERTARLQEIRLLNSEVRLLHDAVPWLASLRDPSLSLGLIYFLDDAANALLRERADLILNAHSTYMYSTMALEPPFATLLGELGKEVPAGPIPLLITYPTLEEERVLLHPILVHELGHDAVSRHGLDGEVFKHAAGLDELDRRFGEAVKSFAELQRESGAEPLSQEEAALMLRQQLTAWMEELLCDHLALAYLGPSYLFSAVAFLLPVGGPQPSETHPSAPLRIKLLLEFLGELEWITPLNEAVPDIMDWLTSVAAEPAHTALPEHVQFLQEAMYFLATSMRGVVTHHLQADTYRPSTYEPVAEELMNLLAHEVLPAQLSNLDPVDRRAILVAGWLHSISRKGSRPESIPDALSDLDMQRFLAKALEMSSILERWRSV